MKPLTSFQVVRDSLRHHRRIHIAVALGTAAATAVLTGALLVGDSVRGSLRETALDRLARIDEVLIKDKFFREDLANDIDGAASSVPAVVGGVVLEGSVSNLKSKTNAAQVNIYGIDDLWAWMPREITMRSEPRAPRTDGEVEMNAALADELGVSVGDEVILRLPVSRAVPEESPLGRKDDSVANSPRLRVSQVWPNHGLGGLSLRPNQQTPRNAFVNRAVLQKAIDKPDRVNSLFVISDIDADGRDAVEQLSSLHQELMQSLHPKLADYGLAWSQAKPGYFSLTTDRMLFDPATAAAALDAYKQFDPQPVFTYLANTIASGGKEIPYSTISALDMSDVAPLGPFKTPDGKPIAKIADDEIVLSKWAADDLGVQPGAEIRIAYFEPESTHAEVKEAEATFKLAAIVDLKAQDDPFLTPDLTPELPGVTDQLKMGDWDPPFPYDGKRVRDKDEEYWDDYKATPKAFVSYATGKKLWGSRFGDMTSLRIAPRPGLTIEELAKQFQPDPASLGFAFQPVKLQALEASSGTTPFEGLFIGFSFFIIAAAVMLTLLLFKLGVEQRATEVGLMLALGLGLKRVSRMLLIEGAIVAALGAGLGVGLGVGYAWLMLAGLRTLWLDAVTVPFLTLFVTSKSLVIGYVSGVVVSVLAIWWALRSLKRLSVRRLLANQAAESDLTGGNGGLSTSAQYGTSREALPDKPEAARTRVPISSIVQWGALVLAVVVAASAMSLKDEAQAGAFFGSAALVLTGLLTLLRRKLAAARFGSLVNPGPGRVALLAVRNAGRNPGRSTLTIGLVAAAAFLIVAVSAFRVAPPSSYVEKSSGTGGFALVAQSDLSILPDLNTEDGQIDLNFSQKNRKQLEGTTTYPFRFKPGDDASCLNLYQTTQPKILGATSKFIDRGGFSWADSAAATDAEKANPWLLLKANAGAAEVPVVIDQATSMYSLHLSGVGATYDVKNSRNETVTLKVVGLLRNSILQGSLIIDESAFKQHFPEVGGYRYFLIEAAPEREADVSQALESTLADFGFDAQRSDKLLAGFLAVQNTYLSTFQSLGGLGLLLGTFGLAVVQLRNVLERRGELALMRAVGLSESLLGRLVFWENLALLVGGVGCGAIAAAVAVLPQALLGGAGVPWLPLVGTLGVVVVVGLLAGAVVVQSVLKMPLLQSLRGE